jgi:hypothetical protein
VVYYRGQGVNQDYAEAASWLGKAAEQGGVDAQYSLGAMYEEGHGVPRDTLKAMMWFGLAERQGHPEAGKAKQALLKRMTRAEIESAQHLIEQWEPQGEPIPE